MPNLQPPQQPRRMTMPSSSSPRPPSPLRNGFTYDTSTGIDPALHSESGSDDDDDDDDDDYDRARRGGGRRQSRSPSPSPSVTQIAANLAHRVGSLVSSISPRSPSASSAQLQFPNPPSHHPGLTAAEIEAEAERERDRSRREAERILTAEAEERKRVEERVLALLQKTNNETLPPPPSRSQTLPPSPTPSQKEGISGWWQAAKNKLTPTKEPLTPAQQVIQETKAREKEEKKRAKEREKEKEKDVYSREYKGKDGADWPANPNAKYTDPTLLKLNTPQVPRKPPPQIPASPSSPTPSRGIPSGTSPQPSSDALLPPISASPKPISPSSSSPRPQPPYAHASPSAPSLSSNLASPHLLASPANKASSAANSPTQRQPTPLPIYATFTPAGTLDIPATVLTIARRFEKLERWTVGHVRALEERMGDVESWLVEKENVREAEKNSGKENGQVNTVKEDDAEKEKYNRKVQEEMGGMREDLGELQSRVSMLGRELAKLAMAMPSSPPPPPPPQLPTIPPTLPQQSSGPPMPPDFPSGTNFSGTLGDLDLTPSRMDKRDSQWGDLPLSSGPSKMPVQVRETPRKASEQGIVSESEDELGDQASVDTSSRAASRAQDQESQTTQDSGQREDQFEHDDVTNTETSKDDEIILGLGLSPITSPHGTPHRRVPSLTARESTSPPLAARTTRGAAIASKRGSGTRLPYPTGDYAPPPPGTEHTLSPSSTGAGSPEVENKVGRMRPVSIAGLPSTTSPPPLGGPTRVLSPGPVPGSRANAKAIGNRPLPTPTVPVHSQRLMSPRPSPSPSTSPTPRKRYTVALGEPITRASAIQSESDNDANEGGSEAEAESEDDAFADETIGKKASARMASSLGRDASSSTTSLNSLPPESGLPPPTPGRQRNASARNNEFSSNSASRAAHGHKPRAQSVYGLSSVYQTAPPKPVAPLNPGRLRSSRSNDRFNSDNGSGTEGGKGFVDPLLLRKQEKEKKRKEIAMPKPVVGKKGIGDLVAFFDGEKS